MARPEKYTDESRVCIRARGKTKLQRNTDRRAIIEFIIDQGGCVSLLQIDNHFGFDQRDKVKALVRCGWLELESNEEEEV